ncbi:MAG: alpha/beta hydrolase [Ideonella sp.]|nr:alpha/beta hydrolase [Ideonella sp.]
MRKWMTNLTWLAALAVLQPAASGQTLRERFAARQAAEGGPAGYASPFTLPQGVVAERDVAYGDDPAQKLDVYRPSNAVAAPILFMAHGGGWKRGDKAAQGVVKNKVTYWSGKGYILVSVDYRVLPKARPLDQADDIAKALAFVQAKAKAWGGDPSQMLLMGHSAGAHLVSLLTADPTIATRAGAKPWLGTISLDSAAFDVVEIMQRRHFDLYDDAFAKDPEVWRESSPTHRLKAKPGAPLLAVCSSRRRDACPQAKAFAAKAEALGGRVVVLPVDMAHGEVNALLGLPGQYTQSVADFMRSLGLP